MKLNGLQYNVKLSCQTTEESILPHKCITVCDACIYAVHVMAANFILCQAKKVREQTK